MAYLDLLRVISVALVMYGHFVSVGGGAAEIPNIINGSERLPIIDASAWRAYMFEIFLISHFSTESAILGVSIFFLITGYLMPAMCERYDRRGFLVNRFFRIFPTLAISMVFVGGFLYAVQGLTFSIESYISSISLSFFYTGVGSIAGVLWTLAIEVAFYLIACAVGVFSYRRLVLVQAMLLLLIFIGVHFKDNHYAWIIGWQARFLLMITIGSAWFLAEKKECIVDRIYMIVPSLIISFVGFQLFKFGRVDPSTYETVGTHLLSIGIFLLLWVSGRYMNRIPEIILKIADMVYPLYLIHAAVGLSCMILARRYWDAPYFLLAVAVFSSVAFSWLLHVLVERPSIAMGKKFASKAKLLSMSSTAV